MPDLTRRALLVGLSGAAASWLVPGCSPAPSGPPNLLFLLSDDQRWDTLGCAGNPVVSTPNLDALARRGTLFTQAFVTTSICPASRASILTGLRAGHHDVFGFDASVSPDQMAQSYPALLRAAGYETAFIGKWGVDANRRERLAAAAPYFDYWAGAGWQDNYWHEARCRYVTANGRVGATDNECTCPPDAAGVAGGRPRVGHANQVDPLHLTTQILPRRFQDFLDTRVGKRPFCASISFKAPHVPSQDFDPRYAELYQRDEIPLRATVALEPDPALPPLLRDSLSASRDPRLGGADGIRDELRNLYRHITGLDFAVGEMLRALEKRGLDGDTVVLFTSDNGRLMGEHGLWGKWLMYEESIRVPFLVFDPRLRWPQRRGRCDAMVLNVDVAPTLCELGGAAPAADIDGRSVVPLLHGDVDSLRDDWFYEHRYRTRKEPIARSEGIRSTRWKYVCFLDEEPARELLFDLEADPGETRDLSRDPAHTATLEALRERWRAERGGTHPRRARGRLRER